MTKALYTLKVFLPVDETYEKLSEILRTKSYRKIFWHSIAAPHKFEYHFAPLNEKQVDGYKEFFRELYKDSKYKTYCRFEVEDYKE